MLNCECRKLLWRWGGLRTNFLSLKFTPRKITIGPPLIFFRVLFYRCQSSFSVIYPSIRPTAVEEILRQTFHKEPSLFTTFSISIFGSMMMISSRKRERPSGNKYIQQQRRWKERKRKRNKLPTKRQKNCSINGRHQREIYPFHIW